MFIPRPGSVNSRSAQNRSERVDSGAPLVSHSLAFSYADAGELQKDAEKLLSPKGSLSLDKRTNRLLIRDNQTVVETLARALRWVKFLSNRSSWRRIL